MVIVMKILAAVTSGLCLLGYFYLKDKDEPEPLRLVFIMFLSGGLVVFPMLVIQNEMNQYFTGVFSQSFIVSGLSEEFIKWFIVYFLIYHHTEFDEHFDGIVYAVAAAAGYATVENVLYVFFQSGDVIPML